MATRDRGGKSTVARMVVQGARRVNLKAVIVRHPMPYGDLEAQTVQHFKSIEDFKKHKITIEEEEEYVDHIEQESMYCPELTIKKSSSLLKAWQT